MNTVEPIRPEQSDMAVNAEVEAILRERLASFDEDRKKAVPASEVFRRILQSPNP